MTTRQLNAQLLVACWPRRSRKRAQYTACQPARSIQVPKRTPTRSRDVPAMRLAALSNARLNPWISWSALAPPLLNALTSRDDTVLACPPALTWANRAEWRRVVRETRGADTLFWLQWSARPELPLWLLAGTVPLARRTALVLDAWRPQLAKIGMLAVAQRLDPCFVAYREACDELELRFPRGRFEWLPVGVDTGLLQAEFRCERHLRLLDGTPFRAFAHGVEALLRGPRPRLPLHARR